MKFLLQVMLSVLLMSTIYASEETASILYFNDGHVIYPISDHLGQRGGVARLKTVIDDVKKENKNTFVVFGGDLGGGLLFGAVYKGLPMVEAYNKIPIDLANFGQHDFDFGPEHTIKLIDESDFQWISTNLKNEHDKPFGKVKEYFVKEIAGIKIAFLGITDSMNTTTPSKKVVQKDIIKSVKNAIIKIEKQNVDYIIAVTQAAQSVDEELLKKFPEIKAVFSEERAEAQTHITYFADKPILSPCGNVGSVIRLNLRKVNNKIKTSVEVYPVDESVKSDKTMKAIEDKYREKLEKDLGKKIATLKQPLDAGFDTDAKSRFKETNVGNLITDSYRDYYKADLAFMNGGGIRANAPKGNFTLKQALAIIPFSNPVGLYVCSGKTILEALEYGVSKVDKKAGCFLQVSGISYTYNPEGKIGHRIKSILIDGKPIVMNKKYSIAMPIFIYKGGDGFTMFKNAKELIPEDSARKDIEIFSDYCKKKGVISSKTEGRIKIVNQ
jgi:2',3'-cyclic-nucleotide 2'-phosphodiesterase (5'-nucleotidase family)